MQNAFRQAFVRWGRPGLIRVDNGYPWGSAGELPTDLALWLIGLGIAVHWNRPRQPRENGVVERGQGVGKVWTEPQTCDSAAALQRRFNEMDRLQREDYPVGKGPSRMELYPGLKHSGRRYRSSSEGRLWQLQRVLEHLAGYAVPRRINPKGMVSIYDWSYYVSVARSGDTVYVHVDPQRREWVVTDEQDRQLRRWPTEQLTAATICGLRFSRRRRGQRARAAEKGTSSGRH